MANEISALYIAEKELIEHAISGTFADFSDDAKWSGNRRVVRARVLRRLLLGLTLPPLEEAASGTSGEAKVHDVRSICAISPTIEGKLNLVEAIGPEDRSLPPLILHCALFTDDGGGTDIDAQHARLARLSLQDCKFTRIVLTDAKVRGDVDLCGAEPVAKGGVCQIVADGCQVEGSFKADGCNLRIGSVQGDNLSNTEHHIEYALNLTNARIEGDISLRCQHEPSTCPAGPEGEGEKRASRSFRADGVRLDLARVRGSVFLDGAALSRATADVNKEGYALHAHNCRIEGSLFMPASRNQDAVERFRAFGCISLAGSRIDGDLDCRGALLRDLPEGSPEPAVLSLDKDWYYSLNARDAIIGGDVLFRVSKYKIAGRNLGFLATNRICLSGATIGGELNCRGSQFLKELDLNNVSIETNVLLGSKRDSAGETFRFQSDEAVKLRNARIKGRFECVNAILKSPEDRTQHPEAPKLGLALDASEFRVDGNLVFSPTLEADAKFSRCRVGGDLDLSDLHIVISSPNAPRITFSDSIIDRRITLYKDIKIEGTAVTAPLPNELRPRISLDGVEVSILADNGGLSWGDDVLLTLDGLTYKYLEQTKIPPKKGPLLIYFFVQLLRWLFGTFHLRISEDRQKWLNLQYKRKRRRFAINRWLLGQYRYKINRRTYRAQPYEQLAKVLDDQGWNEDSRHILVRKLWLDGMWVGWAIQPFHSLFGYLFDFGLAHRKAIVVLLSYLIAGGFLFDYASSRHLLVVDQNAVTTMFGNRADLTPAIKGFETGQSGTLRMADSLLDTSDMDCGNAISPWIFALDSAVPFLDLREHQRCTIRTPKAASAVRISLRYATVNIPVGDFFGKSWRYKALDLPIPDASIESEELLWRYIRATYSAIGWMLTSISILILTGTLRRAAEQ